MLLQQNSKLLLNPVIPNEYRPRLSIIIYKFPAKQEQKKTSFHSFKWLIIGMTQMSHQTG